MKNTAIVIDNENIKVELVLIEPKEENFVPLFYQLKKNEKLVFEDIAKALSMCKPKWTGKEWVETATESEVEQWLYPNGKPQYIPPSKTNAELEEELTLTQMAVAEGYEENLLLKEELKNTNALLDVASGAIVEIYEMLLLGGE